MSYTQQSSKSGQKALRVLDFPFPNMFFYLAQHYILLRRAECWFPLPKLLPRHLKELFCAQLKSKLTFFRFQTPMSASLVLTRLQLLQCPHFWALRSTCSCHLLSYKHHTFLSDQIRSLSLPLLSKAGLGCWNINVPFACPLFGSHFNHSATTAILQSPVGSIVSVVNGGCYTHTLTHTLPLWMGILDSNVAPRHIWPFLCGRALSFSDIMSHLWSDESVFRLVDWSRCSQRRRDWLKSAGFMLMSKLRDRLLYTKVELKVSSLLGAEKNQ